ncbi:MAG: GAF domain-containing protein [Anaerolineales bacterium]|nr:GAF domain-containing protein [Anaerolineales bacterium]
MAAEKRSIPLNREQSLVARAARERKGVTVNDVTLSPDFLPNPLLPDTRAELAVPMLVGQTLIGVFDIQSDVAGRFTETDVNIQTTLAAQLASSVQNARSFERSRSQVEFETLVNTINQKIQRTDSVEETLQTAIRELGTAIGTSRVKAVLSATRTLATHYEPNFKTFLCIACQCEGDIKMDNTKTVNRQEDFISQYSRTGTIILAILVLLVGVYFLNVVFKQPPSVINYITTASLIVATALALFGLFSAIREQPERAEVNTLCLISPWRYGLCLVRRKNTIGFYFHFDRFDHFH